MRVSGKVYVSIYVGTPTFTKSGDSVSLYNAKSESFCRDVTGIITVRRPPRVGQICSESGCFLRSPPNRCRRAPPGSLPVHPVSKSPAGVSVYKISGWSHRCHPDHAPSTRTALPLHSRHRPTPRRRDSRRDSTSCPAKHQIQRFDRSLHTQLQNAFATPSGCPAHAPRSHPSMSRRFPTGSLRMNPSLYILVNDNAG